MNKLLFLIILCTCNLFLYAQPNIKPIQVENVKLGECQDKAIKDRYEMFSYNESYNSTENCFLLEFFHKDILVNSSCSNINVEITCSNDTVFIREMEIKDEPETNEKCLRDLSYQIKGGNHHDLFLVLISDVSSIPYQVFYTYANYQCHYPITEKLSYQYKPFIMDGSCEWIINTLYGFDGYKKIISNEDTLISNKVYKKIFDHPCKHPTEKIYSGAIREENRQIFFVDTKLDPSPFAANEVIPERMLYDFNLKAGDRMEYEDEYADIFPDDDLEPGCKVLHVDTILVEGIPRRKYYFYYAPFESWTEGIGSEYVFTRPFPHLMTGFNPVLAGVWRNGKALFCDSYKCTCEEMVSVIEHKSTPRFRVLNNPVENRQLSIYFSESDFTKLELYSFDGILQYRTDLTIRDGILDIPLTGLHAGNYILILSRPDNSRESCKVIIQ